MSTAQAEDAAKVDAADIAKVDAVGAAKVEAVAHVPPPMAAALNGVLAKFAALPGAEAIAALNGTQLLLERMLCTGARFRDGCSPSGSCRFMAAQDSTLAVNLPRRSDWELLPAWLETDSDGHWNWARVATIVRERASGTLLDRARLLGLAVAATGGAASILGRKTAPHLARREQPDRAVDRPCADVHGDPLAHGNEPARRSDRPLVLDLSALWAGPLCANLLWLCGARVIKVESADRPDGARDGDPAFYALLNQGKKSVVIDFRADSGRRMLRHLIGRADIVIESSRPRALRQLGIVAEDWVRGGRGRTWIGITGYGRGEPVENWVAFGDDAGVAAGLADLMHAATGTFQFAGDAVADPLAGVRAAEAAWRSWLTGGSRLVSLSLAGVASHMLADEIDRLGEANLVQAAGHWWRAARHGIPDAGCTGRGACAPVSAYGEDTEATLRELCVPC